MSEIVPLDEAAARHVVENLSATGQREMAATHGPDYVEPTIASLLNGQDHAFAYKRGGEAQGVFVGKRYGEVYFAFLLFTDRFPALSPHLSKFVTATIMPAVADSPASRAESLSLTDTHTAHGWLRRLGAKPVQFMPGVGRQGEDAILWRWVRDDEFGFQRRRGGLQRPACATGRAGPPESHP